MSQEELYNKVIKGRKLDLVGDFFWTWDELLSHGRIFEGEVLYFILNSNKFQEKEREILGPVKDADSLGNIRTSKTNLWDFAIYACKE